jgi:hypothetical protein
MVRVPGCHYHLIAPVLDAGAMGYHGADGGDRSSGAADRVLVPIPALPSS